MAICMCGTCSTAWDLHWRHPTCHRPPLSLRYPFHPSGPLLWATSPRPPPPPARHLPRPSCIPRTSTPHLACGLLTAGPLPTVCLFQVLIPDLGPATVYATLEKNGQLSTLVRGPALVHAHPHMLPQALGGWCHDTRSGPLECFMMLGMTAIIRACGVPRSRTSPSAQHVA